MMHNLIVEITILRINKSIAYIFCAQANPQNGVKQRHGCRCSNFERVAQDALTRY